MVGDPLDSIRSTIDDLTVDDPYGGDGLDYGDFTAGDGVSGQPLDSAQETAADIPDAAGTVTDAAGDALESLPWEAKATVAAVVGLGLLLLLRPYASIASGVAS